MPRDLRRTVAVPLVFASATGLLACPQLLQDDFGALSGLGGGSDGCDRRLNCTAGSAGSGGAGGASNGGAGATSGTGGAQSTGGSMSGASGEAGTSGQGGADGGTGGEQPDAGVDPPVIDVPDAAGPDPGPDCWVITLNDTTHTAGNNCLGINGWNGVETDSSGTTVTSSYVNGEACFEGTIVPGDWGAIFNLTLNDESAWNATAAGVSGFQFEHTGPSLPPEIRVIYNDDAPGDFCHRVTPSASNVVPFSSAHPNCNSSGAVPDVTDLRFIRLALPPDDAAYDIDYCLTIRAIP